MTKGIIGGAISGLFGLIIRLFIPDGTEGVIFLTKGLDLTAPLPPQIEDMVITLVVIAITITIGALIENLISNVDFGRA